MFALKEKLLVLTRELRELGKQQEDKTVFFHQLKAQMPEGVTEETPTQQKAPEKIKGNAHRPVTQWVIEKLKQVGHPEYSEVLLKEVLRERGLDMDFNHHRITTYAVGIEGSARLTMSGKRKFSTHGAQLVMVDDQLALRSWVDDNFKLLPKYQNGHSARPDSAKSF